MDLTEYMNTFNRMEHSGELKRLCETIGISRNHFYVAKRGEKVIGGEIAIAFTRETDGAVDPRTFTSNIDWETLDAYYATQTDFGVGALGLARKARPAAKPEGSGRGKGNAASARRPMRR